MPAGFQCWNNGGFLQVDGSNKNLMLVSKQTKNTVPETYFLDPLGYFWQSASLAFNAANPVVAIMCEYPVVLVSSSAGQSPPYAGTIEIGVQSPVPVAVTFYVFGSQVASGSNFGLQIFDSAGNIVFDGINKQMRVVGFHSPAGNIHANGDATEYIYTYPAGMQYAFIMSAPMGVGLWLATGDPVRGWINGVKNLSSTIRVQQKMVELGSVPWNLPLATPGGELDRSIIILDVTNY